MTIPYEVLERSKKLVELRKQRDQELLRTLPQGPGSGLDADTVDGLHAQQIVDKAQRTFKGGNGGGGGILPQPYHYLIFEEGTVKALNGLTGYIDFNDPDYSKVVNAAFDSLTSGRTWKEKVLSFGNFTTGEESIKIPSYTILEIIGKISVPSSYVGHIIETKLIGNINQHFKIRGGFIDGSNQIDGGAASVCCGINLVCARDFIVEGVTVYNTQDANLRIRPVQYDIASQRGLITGNTFDTSRGSRPATDGISLMANSASYPSEHIVITNNIIRNQGLHGIETSGYNQFITIGENTIKNSGYYGIQIHGSTGVDNTRHITAVNNKVVDSGYDGIWCDYCRNVQLIANTVVGSGQHGIELTSNTQKIRAADNDLYNNTSGAIKDDGSLNCINGLGREAAGIGGTPTAANWDVGDVVRNTDDNTLWIKDYTGTMRKLA